MSSSFNENKYEWGFHDDSKYQPFISWTDCPPKVVYSSFNQKNWKEKLVHKRPADGGDSTVTIDNIYQVFVNNWSWNAHPAIP